MANIAYSAIVNEIRGKMGTDVFSRARSGPTARVKSSVSNPKTGPQRDVRSYLGKAAKTYKAMDAQTAASWVSYGETQIRHNPLTGETYTLSGVCAFIELAAKYLQINPAGSIPTTPPANVFTGDALTFTVNPDDPGYNVTASGPNSTGTATEILYQKLNSGNCEPNPEGYTHYDFVTFAAGMLTTNVALPTGVYALAYRYVNKTTGQATDVRELEIVNMTTTLRLAPNKTKKAA